MVEGAWALTSGTWAQILTPPYGHTVVSGLSLCFSEPQFPHLSHGPGCHSVAGAVALSVSAAGREAQG